MAEDQIQRRIAEALESAPQVPYADLGLEVALGMLRVLSRQHGTAFAEAVRQEILDRADRMAASGDDADVADAAEIRAIAEAELWKKLGCRTL